MHVHTMGTRRKPVEARLDDEPRWAIGEHDRADGRSDPAGIDPVDLDAQVFGRRWGACCKGHGDEYEA